MDSVPLPKQEQFYNRPEPSHPLALLRSGLHSYQQGRYSEGIAFFSLVREQLSEELSDFTFELDTLIQDYIDYCLAQQSLQQASEHLLQVCKKQQEHAISLSRLLPEQFNTREDILSAVPSKLSGNHSMPLPPFTHEAEAPLVSLNRDDIPITSLVQDPQQAGKAPVLPTLYFTCFGHFEVKRLGQTVSLCSNRNGQAILRYMVVQPKQRVTKDTLMALLWPEDEPQVASHKLQVAMSVLRRSLNEGYVSDTGGGYILCKNGFYQLNPAASIRIDMEEFLSLYQVGRQQHSISAAIPHYEAACNLYKGPFLIEDLYVDWPIIQREQLNRAYLSMCRDLSEHYFQVGSYEDASKWAAAILKENRCDEAAYRQLMRISLALGRRLDAIQLYQRCERILAEEMDASPMAETVSLFQAILEQKLRIEES